MKVTRKEQRVWNTDYEASKKEQKGMKVRETFGIKSEYTGIEIEKTQIHYVAAHAPRKIRMIVKKATARWIERRASFSGKCGERRGER